MSEGLKKTTLQATKKQQVLLSVIGLSAEYAKVVVKCQCW